MDCVAQSSVLLFIWLKVAHNFSVNYIKKSRASIRYFFFARLTSWWIAAIKLLTCFTVELTRVQSACHSGMSKIILCASGLIQCDLSNPNDYVSFGGIVKSVTMRQLKLKCGLHQSNCSILLQSGKM